MYYIFEPGYHAWQHLITLDSKADLRRFLEDMAKCGDRPVFFNNFVDLWNTRKEHENDRGLVIVEARRIVVPIPVQVATQFLLPD
jgi:hypothetical protein